jgi:hypothetical protein
MYKTTKSIISRKEEHEHLKRTISSKQGLFLFYLRSGQKPYIDHHGDIQLRKMGKIGYNKK